MARGGSFEVKVKIDADRASAEFREARREFNARLKDALRIAGERVVLPVAKRRAAGLNVEGTPIASTLVVRSRSKYAILQSTLRGKKNRAAGLLEFGGTISTPIRPRNAGAIYFPGAAHPVAVVEGSRTIKGRLYLVGAVQQSERKIDDAIRDEMLNAFDGFEVH
jgi:hypothetical protein